MAWIGGKAGHGCELRHKLKSGGYCPLPVITAVCDEQDQLLHVCSTLHYVTLV